MQIISTEAKGERSQTLLTQKLSFSDLEVRDYVSSLGLPGLIDLHVHFMPDNVMQKVWRNLEASGPLIGSPWPVHYKKSEGERIELLEQLGVLRYGALNYPHKPDMAQWLNAWSAVFAKENPKSFHNATFFAEPGADRYVAEALTAGAELFKVHIQVGGFDPRDPHLDAVWQLLESSHTPIVIHCGSGPTPGDFTGIGPIAEIVERHANLILIIAHMGNPDYRQFLDLALSHPNIFLDTTMVFTEFTEKLAPFPSELIAHLDDLGEKIVLGSDFPNIPYPYADQLSALANLGLGDDWIRGVLYQNAARLMNVR